MGYFLIHIVTMILIISIFLVGQQLLLFDLGLLCLGSVSFFAGGAYITAVLSKLGGISPFLSVLISSLSCVMIAIVVGYPLLKYLKKDFFAIATLGLAQATLVILRSLAPGGNAGMAGIPPLHSPLNGFISDSAEGLLIISIFAGVALWFVKWIRVRRIGMLTQAVRLDDNALSILGFNPVFIKLQIFAISALMAGSAGAMQAHYLGVVEPNMSSVFQTVMILCGTILSGRSSVLGTIMGASFLIVLPELLQEWFTRYLGTSWQVFPIVHIIYGLFILIVAVRLFPRKWTSFRYESEVTKC